MPNIRHIFRKVADNGYELISHKMPDGMHPVVIKDYYGSKVVWCATDQSTMHFHAPTRREAADKIVEATKQAKERSVQSIFDLMIALGRYYKGGIGYRNGPNGYGAIYMCISLDMAAQREEITERERQKATQEISEYIGADLWEDVPPLIDVLRVNGYDIEPFDVYSDWKNRPKLSNKI